MNKILGQYTAEVEGIETGLAGCSNDECNILTTCLRAAPQLTTRVRFLGGKGCLNFIPVQDRAERIRGMVLTSDELEVDGDARISEGDDNGCFVAAWVWVDFSGTEFDKEVDGE